ncbi:hypothetical protein B0T13DRAFT_185165 [Neurospora crassa]|nr:hypothetical protein B0T13DRAFT_185165 [Neurospora crassa]
MILTSSPAVLLSTITLFAQLALGFPTTSEPVHHESVRAIGELSHRDELHDAGVVWNKVVRQSPIVSPTDPRDSFNNQNPDVPGVGYPRSSDADPAFTIPEAKLRSAIFLPTGFNSSTNRQVVLFVPGTGAYGHESFADNLLKVITNAGAADAVWVNVPNAMLDDVQSNAEYIAYAISYVKALIGDDRDLNVIGWSQGNLATQWVLTYWPSTVPKVRQLISVSPDFHGTMLAYGLCAGNFGKVAKAGAPCPPSVLQQLYSSNLINTLRAAGGGDAQVPTTSFWSRLTDEVVQPQAGLTASARMGDARNKGVTNVEVQTVCGLSVGSGQYGHSTLMAHPLVAAMTLDALKNGGPASLSRIRSQMFRACSSVVAPGLQLTDRAKTEGLLATAGVRMGAFPTKLLREPALRQYAA